MCRHCQVCEHCGLQGSESPASASIRSGATALILLALGSAADSFPWLTQLVLPDVSCQALHMDVISYLVGGAT